MYTSFHACSNWFCGTSSCEIALNHTESVRVSIYMPKPFVAWQAAEVPCRTVWSDNAKTFKVVSKEIQKFYDDPSTQSQAVCDTLGPTPINTEIPSKGITWKFITESSPWWGGWWERFFRAIKALLRKVLVKALLTYSEMNILLISSLRGSSPFRGVARSHARAAREKRRECEGREKKGRAWNDLS